MNLGENIYRLRTQKNMSQGDLADALEVSRQSVSKWENNSAVPELDKLSKMSRIFGVTLDELVHGEQAPKNETGLPSAGSVPQRSPMPKNWLVGIIFLTIGLISLIGLTAAGYFMGFILLGAVVGVPFILNGIVCMVADKHTLFAVCWVNYTLLFIFNFMVTMYSVGASVSPAVIISFVLLAALVAWSIYKLYKGHFMVGRIARAVWTVILALLLVAHLLFMLPTQSGGQMITDAYPEEEYVYME